MEATQALGLDLKLFIAQVVNFLIVLFVLRKFLYKPVLNMLDQRSEKIKEGIDSADKAKAELEEAKSKAQIIISEAEKEAKEIKKEVKEKIEAEKKEIISKAEDSARGIQESAKKEAREIKEKAVNDAKKEIAGLVMLSLNKIVQDEINDEQKEKMTEKAISRL